MKKKTYKVGEEIVFKNDFEIESFNGRKISVKKDDKAIVASRGFIKYTTGNARDMNQVLEGVEVKGYDHRNIAKMIMKRLNNVFDLEDYLDYEETECDRVIEEIEDVLTDIF